MDFSKNMDGLGNVPRYQINNKKCSNAAQVFHLEFLFYFLFLTLNRCSDISINVYVFEGGII